MWVEYNEKARQMNELARKIMILVSTDQMSWRL